MLSHWTTSREVAAQYCSAKRLISVSLLSNRIMSALYYAEQGHSVSRPFNDFVILVQDAGTSTG